VGWNVTLTQTLWYPPAWSCEVHLVTDDPHGMSECPAQTSGYSNITIHQYHLHTTTTIPHHMMFEQPANLNRPSLKCEIQRSFAERLRVVRSLELIKHRASSAVQVGMGAICSHVTAAISTLRE